MRGRFSIAALTGGVLAAIALGWAGLGLMTGAPLDYRPLSSAIANASLGQFEITSPIQIADMPIVVIERGRVRADPAQVAKALATQVAGGRPVLTHVALENAALVVHVSSAARGVSERSSEAHAPLVEALASMGFDSLQVKGSTVSFRSNDGGIEDMTEVALALQSRGRHSFSVKGSMHWRGALLDLDGSMAKASQAGRYTIKAALKSPWLDAAFDGALDAGRGMKLEGEAEGHLADARATARWLGLALPPGAGLRDLKVKGRFLWADSVLAFQTASFAMDGSEATGTLSLETGREPPQVEGTLAFKVLDLATHFTQAAPPGAPTVVRPPLDWDIRLPMLRHIDADLRLSADRLALPGLDLGRAAITLSVRRGRLLADIAEMELDGGRVGGQLTVDMSGDAPRYSIRSKAESLDATKALATMLTPGWLQGKANLAADISGVGVTLGELLNDFAGRVSIVVPHGGRLAVDMRALLAPPRLMGANPVVAAYKGSTGFPSAEIRGYLQHGELLIGSGRLSLGPDLEVNLLGNLQVLERRVELSLMPADPSRRRSKSGDVAPRGSNLRAVRLNGPWAAPQISEIPVLQVN